MIRAVIWFFILLLPIFFVSTTLAKSSSGTAAAKKSIVAKKHHAKKHRVKKSAVSRRIAKKSRTGAKRRVAAYQLVRHASRIVHPALSMGDKAGLSQTDDPLNLRSNAALVLDPASDQVLFEKNAEVALPIASITKLMTAMVVIESQQDLDEVLTITKDDIDRLKYTGSRLPIGARLTRAKMLHIALMSSENRAASALGRNYPGGLSAFVAAMNAKAKALGMDDTYYAETTGLSSQNVSSASDLARLVIAAHAHPIIRQYTTHSNYDVNTGRTVLRYHNSNRLIANSAWEIDLQKTGFINEAGRCLVMYALIAGRPIVMVFLDSKGKYSRGFDAGSIRKWLEDVKLPAMTLAGGEVQG